MTQFHKPDIELNRGAHQLLEHERVAQDIPAANNIAKSRVNRCLLSIMKTELSI